MVEKFLKFYKLDALVETFRVLGFDDLDFLKNLTEDELEVAIQEMKLAPGHRNC